MHCPPKAKIAGSNPAGCATNKQTGNTGFFIRLANPRDKNLGSTTSRFWKHMRTKIVTVAPQAFMPRESADKQLEKFSKIVVYKIFLIFIIVYQVNAGCATN